VNDIKSVADRVVTVVTGREQVFYVSDYYRYWQDITDAEVLQCLKEWRMRRNMPKIDIQVKRNNA
jgi:predicted phosphoribosyltransferase